VSVNGLLLCMEGCLLQTILFTTDEDILELVAANDQTFEVDAMDEYCVTEDVCNRPSTADDSRDVVVSLQVLIALSSLFFFVVTNALFACQH